MGLDKSPCRVDLLIFLSIIVVMILGLFIWLYWPSCTCISFLFFIYINKLNVLFRIDIY